MHLNTEIRRRIVIFNLCIVMRGNLHTNEFFNYPHVPFIMTYRRNRARHILFSL